jgi:hypothetical protein
MAQRGAEAGSERARGGREQVQDQEEVQQLFAHMAHALTRGDGRSLATLWETPAMIIENQTVITIESPEQVEGLSAGARQQYVDKGIVDTRPNIVRLAWPAEGIALVEVRWSLIDAGGDELGEEVATYTLRRDEGGHLKARVLVAHGTPPSH